MENIFKFNKEKDLVVITKNDLTINKDIGDILFAVDNVIDILGYDDAHKACKDYVSKENKVLIKKTNIKSKEIQDLIKSTGEIFINETGVNNLINNTLGKHKIVKDFRKLLLSEILPIMRKKLYTEENSFGFLIEKQFGEIVDELLSKKLNDYKPQEIRSLINVLREYGMTKTEAKQIAIKIATKESSFEKSLENYLHKVERELIEKDLIKIRKIIGQFKLININTDKAWSLINEELKLCYNINLYALRSSLTKRLNKSTSLIDVIEFNKIHKKVLPIARKIYKQELKLSKNRKEQTIVC